METLITEITKVNNEPTILIPEKILECIGIKIGDEVDVLLNKQNKTIVIERAKKNCDLV